MSVTIANVDFDRVRYDEDADVLYLSSGDPGRAVEFDESPEGHHLRYDGAGNLVGITLVSPRWLLEQDGRVRITLPETLTVADLGALVSA